MKNLFSWAIHGDGKTLHPGEVVEPDERLTWGRTAGIGAQTVSAGNGDGWLFFLIGDGCRDIYSARITYGVSLEGSDRVCSYTAAYQINQPDFLWQMSFSRLEEDLGIPGIRMVKQKMRPITKNEIWEAVPT